MQEPIYLFKDAANIGPGTCTTTVHWPGGRGYFVNAIAATSGPTAPSLTVAVSSSAFPAWALTTLSAQSAVTEFAQGEEDQPIDLPECDMVFTLVVAASCTLSVGTFALVPYGN